MPMTVRSPVEIPGHVRIELDQLREKLVELVWTKDYNGPEAEAVHTRMRAILDKYAPQVGNITVAQAKTRQRTREEIKVQYAGHIKVAIDTAMKFEGSRRRAEKYAGVALIHVLRGLVPSKVACWMPCGGYVTVLASVQAIRYIRKGQAGWWDRRIAGRVVRALRVYHAQQMKQRGKECCYPDCDGGSAAGYCHATCRPGFVTIDCPAPELEPVREVAGYL